MLDVVTSLCDRWFYVALLMPVTVAGIINWCVRSTIECRIKFVQHYLWKTSHVPMDYAEASRWFVLDYLGHDGVFLLRLIEINHGSSVVTTIVDLLYARYVHNLSQQHPTESPVLSTFDMQDIPGPPGPATGQQPVIHIYYLAILITSKKTTTVIFFLRFNIKSRVGHVMSSNQTIAKIKNEKGSISRSILNASHLLVSATDLQTVPSLPRS